MSFSYPDFSVTALDTPLTCMAPSISTETLVTSSTDPPPHRASLVGLLIGVQLWICSSFVNDH
jgi:hypothetical protein